MRQSRLLEVINSSSRETLSAFARKDTPSYFNMANNYYGRVVSFDAQAMRLNTYAEFDPTSTKVPVWQAEKIALINKSTQYFVNAQSWKNLGNLIGTLG